MQIQKDDAVAIADALELLKAFRTIPDPGVRRTVINLAKALRPDSSRYLDPGAGSSSVKRAGKSFD